MLNELAEASRQGTKDYLQLETGSLISQDYKKLFAEFLSQTLKSLPK